MYETSRTIAQTFCSVTIFSRGEQPRSQLLTGVGVTTAQLPLKIKGYTKPTFTTLVQLKGKTTIDFDYHHVSDHPDLEGQSFDPRGLHFWHGPVAYR